MLFTKILYDFFMQFDNVYIGKIKEKFHLIPLNLHNYFFKFLSKTSKKFNLIYLTVNVL